MSIEHVILVDNNDHVLGTMEKMAAHSSGQLHRAFSVFIFDHNGRLLLQQRAFDKYHSPGQWSNTCCSHPRPGEQNSDAARRRLKEEMGLECDLVYGFSFIYHAVLGNGLIEHEFDHVFFGTTAALPVINTQEVAAFAFRSPEEVNEQLKQNPAAYTAWFKICFERVMQHYSQQKND